MKKLTTKLLMSIIAVAFAFVALGTSTYAWFTMSTTVNVTGMEVTAKSNATYLLIGDNAGIANVKKNTDNNDLETTVAAVYTTADNADKKVYPAAYTESAITVGGLSAAANTWYTASNGNPDDPTDDIKNAKAVTAGDKDYMLTYKCWLTLSADSEATTDYKIKTTLSLSALGQNAADDAVSAVVIINGETLTLNTRTTGEEEQTTAAIVSLSPTAAVEVTIYIYIDGNADNVYSDYINGGNVISGTAAVAFDLVKAQ